MSKDKYGGKLPEEINTQFHFLLSPKSVIHSFILPFIR